MSRIDALQRLDLARSRAQRADREQGRCHVAPPCPGALRRVVPRCRTGNPAPRMRQIPEQRAALHTAPHPGKRRDPVKFRSPSPRWLLLIRAEIGGDHLGIVADSLRRAFGDLDAVSITTTWSEISHHTLMSCSIRRMRCPIGRGSRAVLLLKRRFPARSVRAAARRGRARGWVAHRARDLSHAAGSHRKLPAARRRGPEARCVGQSAPDRSRPAPLRHTVRRSGENVSQASISALCCATIRFSSAVMLGNSRMFWKVRATWPA